MSRRTITFSSLLLTAVLSAGGCERGPLPHRKTHLAILPQNFKRGSLEVAVEGDRLAYIVRKADYREYVVDAGKAGPIHDVCAYLAYVPKHGLFHWTYDKRDAHLRLVAGDATLETDIDPPAHEQERPLLQAAKDGSHWIAAGRIDTRIDDPRVAVFIDGTRRAPTRDMTRAAFSPDGKHVAYLAEDDAGRLTLVVDGTARRTFPSTEADISPITKNPEEAASLSPALFVRYLADGSLLVLAEDRAGWTVFHDDVPLASYTNNAWRGGSTVVGVGEYQKTAGILPTTVATAADAPVAVWWERLAGNDERWRVARDGKPADDVLCNRPADAEPLVLSADGKHLLYTCYTGDGDAERGRVILDGVPQWAPARAFWGLVLSNDARHVAYYASKLSQGPGDAGGWVLYRDGQPVTPDHDDMIWRPRFTDDARHLVWEARREASGPRGALGIDGKRMTTFDAVLWGPEFRDPGFVSWIVRRRTRVTRLDIGVR